MPAEMYNEYVALFQKMADVKYAAAVLQWDQETYIPAKGHEYRSRQLATLSETAHEMLIQPATEKLLKTLNDTTTLTAAERKNVQLSLYDYERAKKFSAGFVRNMSEATSKGFACWVKAKKENNFSIFKDALHHIIQLKKEEADILGYSIHPYDALMNDYDKGLNTTIADKVFDDLKPQLLSLLQQISKQPQVDDRFLVQHYPKDEQWKFGIEMLKQLHFDFEAGRQDISEHPFTTNFNAQDVRVTTRIDENDFGNMTWSCLHEGGHALYEQGLPATQYGLPLGEYCSLSIHESQSRLWENMIGRSLPFWKHNFSKAQAFFKQQLGAVTAQQFYKGINKTGASLIRTEADELTYHFHVMIRYGIEKKLIEGSLATADIPAVWNELYKNYLGLTVPNDSKGCLQDVHWSHGSFGYFATYSLGSLYAAQLYAAIEKENTSLTVEIENGDTRQVLHWLRKNIHAYGRQYTSEEICRQATGEPLNSRYFIEYAIKKYSDIYAI